MTEIVSQAIENYLESLVPPRDATLARVEDDARANHVPMVGPLEGNVLYMIARLARARDILEVGTATGYSAIWLARAAAHQGGHLVGMELDPERHRQAVANLEAAGLADRARIIQGDAFDILGGLTDTFDLVFLDVVRAIPGADKTLRLYELALAHLRPGGVLCVDNVLHAGEVLSPSSPSAIGADTLNRTMARDRRLESTILSIRDGLAVAIKVGD